MKTSSPLSVYADTLPIGAALLCDLPCAKMMVTFASSMSAGLWMVSQCPNTLLKSVAIFT